MTTLDNERKTGEARAEAENAADEHRQIRVLTKRLLDATRSVVDEDPNNYRAQDLLGDLTHAVVRAAACAAAAQAIAGLLEVGVLESQHGDRLGADPDDVRAELRVLLQELRDGTALRTKDGS